jgi:signal transduction histidine kinase
MAKTRLEPRGMRVVVEVTSASGPQQAEANPPRLSPEMETALFRVIQEAINNIARHSAARNVEIRLEMQVDAALLTIDDDGIGFDMAEMSSAGSPAVDLAGTSPADSNRGLGIVGMQERIELLRGELQMMTAPGAGMHIHIKVPLLERSIADD